MENETKKNETTKSDKHGAIEEVNRFIEFSLGDEDYAIPLLMVREVISCPETTPIPKAPPHFVGIMNLRGQVISVIDLRKKLKIKAQENNLEEAVVILDLQGMNLGVTVDSINKVLAFSDKDLSVVPEIESQVNVEYIQGVYKKEKSLTVLLDISRVLDLQALQSIIQKQEAA